MFPSHDPIGQYANRKKAFRDITTRLNNANKRILKLWQNIDAKKTTRKKIVNEKLDFYLYDLTSFDLEQVKREIETIINEEEETDMFLLPFLWFYKSYLEIAMRSGVIQESAWINTIIPRPLLSFDSILSSQKYNDLLTKAFNNNYSSLKSLSEKTIKQVFDVINRGIESGASKSSIRRDITKRFQVAKSAAKRIVETEINKAYNDARMETISQQINAGAPLAVQHISALLATTRPHHAIRHGKAYTPQQQLNWWNQGSNRINCKCTTRSIVVNNDGTVKNKSAQNIVIKRGRDWFNSD